jgi:4-hydroxy-tetrahydrodipicolinate synthase
MRRTRQCCGPDFTILSGDDALTFEMMTDPGINAAGVISVVSNVAPAAVTRLVRLVREGALDQARSVADALAPLFGLVTVVTTEKTPFGEVKCRARNPLAIKTLMTILGLPSGGCRQPLGKMSRQGLEKVLEAARKVYADHPEILQPVADFFQVNIAQRLESRNAWEGLCYPDY